MISVLNNSLEGLTFDPLEPARKMQQGSALHSLHFINDFHWRQKQNKGRQNKGSTLVVENRTGPSILFCKTRLLELVCSASDMSLEELKDQFIQALINKGQPSSSAICIFKVSRMASFTRSVILKIFSFTT